MGVPQIILAQWYDLYDMAVRAEYRGIGIYGNKKVAPDIEAVEFGAAIARVIKPGEESEGFRMRAKGVAEACRKAGGKRAAVDKLMEIISSRDHQRRA
jgi:UDP:flavonoid glycosyltransferase YjiC (YdhE family)